MKSTIYKRELKYGLLDGKTFYVRDMFENYTTGMEELIKYYPDSFNLTTRENAERPESIMYEMFGDPDLADIFVAINNQNYLWATPFNLDAFQDAIEFRMNYVELLMRDRIKRTPVIGQDGNPERDNEGEIIYEPHQLWEQCRIKVSDDIHAADDKARTIVIPAYDAVPFVRSKIKDYLELRKVR